MFVAEEKHGAAEVFDGWFTGYVLGGEGGESIGARFDVCVDGVMLSGYIRTNGFHPVILF